ncbi:hypothetical protein SGUI_0353 [Serinicoccus hydrothermalis]|uniref:Uncharacterized protein n=1 Tax=Serinicoccus hydrothermalis TaxID=1758689 RepID=A0A1B1N8J9_9MICO|nr:hypothetical protein SGUI_0353 [Serinicoccus hydrothermalis]
MYASGHPRRSAAPVDHRPGRRVGVSRPTRRRSMRGPPRQAVRDARLTCSVAQICRSALC